MIKFFKHCFFVFLVLILLIFNPLYSFGENINEPIKFQLSNLADENSINQVRDILLKHLSQDVVDEFFKSVNDYNSTIKNTSLVSKFQSKIPNYDLSSISELCHARKDHFIGFNCRITTFQLLKNSIEIDDGKIDDELLFMDKDAISSGKLLTSDESTKFKRLFSRVKTEATKDISIHAKTMQNYLSQFKFNSNLKMVSVVINDNLDGNYLFIGHVGVLIEDNGKYLFIEKLSFEEPYQAIIFSNENDCFNLLLYRYKDYSDSDTARPFIMVNNEFIK